MKGLNFSFDPEGQLFNAQASDAEDVNPPEASSEAAGTETKPVSLCFKIKIVFRKYICMLKALDPFGNCQRPGPNFIELLKQKILLNNLLSRNEQDTSQKLYSM